MRGPTEEARAEARRRYESGESLSEIEKALGVTRKTLRAWRDKEGWTTQVITQVGTSESKAIQERAQAQVIDIATRKALERAESTGIIDQTVDEMAASLKAHGRVSLKIMQYAEQMLDDGLAGRISPGEKQSRADVFNSVIAGVGRAVEKSREIGGVRSGQISARTSTDDGRRRFEFVVPEPAQQLIDESA